MCTTSMQCIISHSHSTWLVTYLISNTTMPPHMQWYIFTDIVLTLLPCTANNYLQREPCPCATAQQFGVIPLLHLPARRVPPRAWRPPPALHGGCGALGCHAAPQLQQDPPHLWLRPQPRPPPARDNHVLTVASSAATTLTTPLLTADVATQAASSSHDPARRAGCDVWARGDPRMRIPGGCTSRPQATHGGGHSCCRAPGSLHGYPAPPQSASSSCPERAPPRHHTPAPS
jgi:hypothetical protein